MSSLSRIGAILLAPFRSVVDLYTVLKLKFQAKLYTLLWPKPLYRSLGLNDLRVLEVLPALTTRSDEPLRCTLYHESLEYSAEYKEWDATADPNLRLDKRTKAWYAHRKVQRDAGLPCPHRFLWGEYIALSYCWGTGIRSKQLILNGQIVHITETLDSALRSVRGGWGSIRLWADALCINQDDIAERGSEVRRMRKIYGDTVAVYVHLGLEADGSTEGMQMMERIAKLLREGTDLSRYVLEVAAAIFNEDPVPDREGLIAIFQVLCRPYFSRMWIIQELAMGDDQVVVGCGNEGIGLSELRQVLKCIVLNQESFNVIFPPELSQLLRDAYTSSIQLLWAMGRLRELALAPPDRPFTFSELCHPVLKLCMYASSTDPRDKVYGAMSLLPASLVSRVDQGEKNYTLSTKQVFHNFTRSIIEITKELDIIYISSYQQSIQSKLDLPSWSPDWTLRPGRSTGTGSSQDWFFGLDERYAEFDKYYNLPTSWTTDPSRADGGKIPEIQFLKNDSLLSCKGFSIATVDGVCPEFEMQMRGLPDPAGVNSKVRVESPYGDEQATIQALTRTLLLDASGQLSDNCIIFKMPWIGEDDDLDHATRNGDVLEQMIVEGWDTRFFGGGFTSFDMFRHYVGQFVVGNRRFMEYFPKKAVPCPPNASQLEYSIAAANLMGRRLITTTTGHVGLAPLTAISGDKIYVILGCSMPVILRPNSTEEYYEVVGECFVDGFMKGEAMTADDGKQLQEIILC